MKNQSDYGIIADLRAEHFRKDAHEFNSYLKSLNLPELVTTGKEGDEVNRGLQIQKTMYGTSLEPVRELDAFQHILWQAELRFKHQEWNGLAGAFWLIRRSSIS